MTDAPPSASAPVRIADRVRLNLCPTCGADSSYIMWLPPDQPIWGHALPKRRPAPWCGRCHRPWWRWQVDHPGWSGGGAIEVIPGG